MQKTAQKRITQKKGGILTPERRAAILRETRGAWKRPLKETLRELRKIRRGWDRKII